MSIHEPDELGELLAPDPELDPEFDDPEFDEEEFDEEDDEPESLGTADPVVGLSAGRPRSCAQTGDRLSENAATSPIENPRNVISSPSPDYG